MTFTYNIDQLDTPLARVRLEIGDTTDPALFQDEEIQVKLAARADSILLTAADLCDILATRYAQDFDFETDGQSFKRSQKAKAYADMAKALRARHAAELSAANAGLTSIPLTRVDGYSDDLSTRDTGHVGNGGRVRRGYYDNDLPD